MSESQNPIPDEESADIEDFDLDEDGETGPRPGRAVNQDIEALAHEISRLREDRLREQAEIENQRRRMQRDVDQARRFANERLIGDLLPALDSLQAGLDVADADAAQLREGIELTLRQLTKALAGAGFAVIDPQDEVFNPDLHQAIAAESSEASSGTVLRVFQKGYLLNDRLLRPALVVVAE